MEPNKYGIHSPQFNNRDAAPLTHAGHVNPYSKLTSNSNAFNYRSDQLKSTTASYSADSSNTILGANAAGMTKNPIHPIGESDNT